MKLDCELVISKVELHLDRLKEPVACEISFQVGSLHPLVREKLKVSVDMPESFTKFFEDIENLVLEKINKEAT